MHFTFIAETDIGTTKDTNQDSILVKHGQYSGGEVLMAIVCDGMGGLSKGELASATVIRAFDKWFDEELPYELEELDLHVISGKWNLMLKDLNVKLIEYSRNENITMGTTFTGILFVNNQYVISHVGDTRVYRLDNSITQLTNDQTFVAREIKKGTMTVEQAKNDKRRNMLLQCVGASDTLEPEVYIGTQEKGAYIGNEFAESYKYSFDIYGNKVSAIKNRVGAEVDNGHFAYVYDELNRLTEVHQNDTLLRKYSYDAFGNRVSKANYASRMESVTSYTYNVNNQLLSEVDGTMTKDYTYDNRGNLLKVSTGADILKEFTFDATNQMTASFDLVDGQRKKATYTYNGLGHRVGQKISSLIPEYPEKKIRYTIDMTRQYYNLLQKSEGGASQTYYWDGNVVGMESNGVEKFYLQDDFGSPMHLVDIYGTSQECFAFDEFGENLSTSYNNTSQTFGFTGYQTDEVGDLYYAQARRYDASVGRFVSEDKVRGFVILPYTLNHYGYCWNNPVDFVDRDGNLPTVVIGAVIGLAAGALGEVVSQTIDGVQSGKSVLDSLLDVNPGKVVLEAGKGAVTGAVAGTGAGLLVVAGTSGVVEFGGDLLDQKVLQKKEDLDYTHAISNGLWSATTTLVVGGITNEISNVIHPEAKTGTMDYLFGRDKAKAVVKAQYNNARSSSSRAKYWNRLEKIKLQKTLGTIKYGIIETGKTIIDEIKNEIYRDEVNEDIVEEIDKKISCSVY